MRKSRFTEAQIIGKLKQAGAGMGIGELCRQRGTSEKIFYHWRQRFDRLIHKIAGRIARLPWALGI